MARQKNTRKTMHYFLVDVGAKRPIRIGVRARNATQHVILSRTFADVLKGKQKGLAITCANALCALRLDGQSFPHDAYMAEFTDTRAYVVDKLDRQGTPISCVVYAHDEGSFQKEFDKTPKNSLAKMSGVEKMFVLSPPPIATQSGTRTGSNARSGSTGTERDRKKTIIHKGAVARAERQGVDLNPKKVSA